MIEGVRAPRRQHRRHRCPGGAARPGAPLGAVYFPTSLRPMRADLLSRATWQIRTRGGADVYLRLPLDAAVAAVGEANLPALFADMTRYTVSDGMAIDATRPASASSPTCRATSARAAPPRPGDARSVIAACPARLSRRHVDRSAAAPHARLVGAGRTAGLGRQGVAAASADAAATAALTQRLRGEGWLRPDVAGRVAFGLPADPASRSTPSARRSATAPPLSRFAPSRPSCRPLPRLPRRSRPPPIPIGRER